MCSERVSPQRAIENARTGRNRIGFTTLDRISQRTASLKRHMTDLLRIETGECVVDVGCGPGTDIVDTAQIVGDDGLVVGIDDDERMLVEAQARAHNAGVATRTHFVVADAAAIPYAADFFDAARCERLFQHVLDPGAVLREMVRITKPRGRIAVADSDWATLSIDTTEVTIERRIVRALPGLVRNGYAGRELLRLFRLYPLTDVIVEVHPIVWFDLPTFWATSFSLPDIEARLVDAGAVSGKELECFRADLAAAQKDGVFFAHSNMVVVAAVKGDQ